MTAMEKFNLVKRACDEQRICQVNFRNERVPRFIHPLGICLTFSRGLVIVCCVEDATSASRQTEPMISNLPIEDCHQMQMTDKRFKVTSDFVTESKVCNDWLFHI